MMENTPYFYLQEYLKSHKQLHNETILCRPSSIPLLNLKLGLEGEDFSYVLIELD